MAKYKFYGEKGLEHSTHIAKFPIYSLRSMLPATQTAPTEKPVPMMNLALTEEEKAEGHKNLQAILPNKDAKTICLFTYATGLKCYSMEWWASFFAELEKRFGGCNFVELLPVENISNLNFQLPTFQSFDVRVSGSFLANVDIFIGADGGSMHLASAAGADTIGLFSTTNPENYEPYNGKSFAIDTNTGTPAEWVNRIYESFGKEVTVD